MDIKPFTCPKCGEKVIFSYSVSISDDKRYICRKCGTHLVPATRNVIYLRLGVVALTFVFALISGYLLFIKMAMPRTLTVQLCLMAAIVLFYLIVDYLMIVRVVRMKILE